MLQFFYDNFVRLFRGLKQIAQQLYQHFKDENPVFIGVLNGSFVFAADLIRRLKFPCEIEFVKLSSYESSVSSGFITEHLSLSKSIREMTVIVLEDIIDTGCTLDHLINTLNIHKPKRLEVVALLVKNEIYTFKHPIFTCGFEIASNFVIGYGMDLNGYGRNLESLFILKKRSNKHSI